MANTRRKASSYQVKTRALKHNAAKLKAAGLLPKDFNVNALKATSFGPRQERARNEANKALVNRLAVQFGDVIQGQAKTQKLTPKQLREFKNRGGQTYRDQAIIGLDNRVTSTGEVVGVGHNAPSRRIDFQNPNWRENVRRVFNRLPKGSRVIIRTKSYATFAAYVDNADDLIAMIERRLEEYPELEDEGIDIVTVSEVTKYLRRKRKHHAARMQETKTSRHNAAQKKYYTRNKSRIKRRRIAKRKRVGHW